MWKEFKQFALKGNAVDLAVGLILGTAFGRIVSSLVSDILMPPIGLLAGGAHFTNWFITLTGGNYATLAEARAAGAVTVNVGVFLDTVLSFLIVAAASFAIVRQFNRWVNLGPAKAKPDEVILLEEIRDLLREGKRG